MRMSSQINKPVGLIAIEKEMARQNADAISSFEAAAPLAVTIAQSLRRTGRLLLLGMGGSHAVGRAVEPLYRSLGIDAVALPLSEQLGQPLPLAGKTILLTSQSGESAEVLRWFSEAGVPSGTFGLTLEGGSTLARTVPSLVGAGGTEQAFAATRSLTVSFALHLAVLSALGEDPAEALAILHSEQRPDVGAAVAALANVSAVVTSGRVMHGVAEAIALGLTELSRVPCFPLEGGQLRHGPMEMLGPNVGVVLFRARDATSPLVARMALSAREAGSPVVVFDASGDVPVEDTDTIDVGRASGMAAIFSLLPAAQHFMLGFAGARVKELGTPVRSSKITRDE
ncbi:SIS domain-containing protein [Phyllobacterium endophyticum]|uniref:Glutamine--fructose-6-phosphate aminotransferase [isomerizing] n=1 Tax=Phyllobacterium endophyticum TaxID=1149773 RepID=A0A2P7APB9_9HYPH|nr:SIS domain-containing protein [Phyllobacterium endophyticum]PSH56061.1 aminotransferase [Phyllobacterium endophyticum]TYR41213.1 SIS domain-containing protein [Phyllobacterium endophyticum]